jgi:hypothetical protein
MTSCPSCGAPLADTVAFCDQCGGRVGQPPAGAPPPQGQAAPVTGPPPEAASPNAVRVCASCGTIAPLEKATCAVCEASLAMPALVEPRPDGVMFATVFESDFQCRSCGLRSALDSLYVEPEVDCHRCGTTQVFDVSQWKDSLNHAHAVADLSGPPAEGQGSLLHGQPLKGDNPFKALGVGFTSAELSQSGMTISAAGTVYRTLRVKVATGHPVCPSGHGAVVVELGETGSAKVTCPTCNDPATYVIPASARELASTCVGVVDDEHRKDRSVVKMQASAAGGGAVALTCPRCNASLPATQTSNVVTCQFCNTVSYLPKRAFLKLNPQQKSRAFWIMFRGPSLKRLGTTGEDGDTDEESHGPTEAPPLVAPRPPVAAIGPLPTPPPSGRALPLAIAFVLSVLVLGGVLAAFALLRPDQGSRPTPAGPAPQHGGTPHHPTRH